MLIVGIGGSTRPTSITDRLLHLALSACDGLGASTAAFTGDALGKLPMYGEDPSFEDARELAAAVARADGVIIATPGYHGGFSGLVKNGLDHLELLRDDERPYLDGRAVGVIVTAAGWQACGTTLGSVRSTVHSLRGWPTPYGVAVNVSEPVFGEDGKPVETVDSAVRLMAGQVVDFARRFGS